LFTTDADSVEFVDITPELPAPQEISPTSEVGVIGADVYGLDDDGPTITVPNVLLVTEDFDPATACDIVTRCGAEPRISLPCTPPPTRSTLRPPFSRTPFLSMSAPTPDADSSSPQRRPHGRGVACDLAQRPRGSLSPEVDATDDRGDTE
jgi:hypothetical protein